VRGGERGDKREKGWQLCQHRATLKHVFTNKGFRVHAFSTAQQSGSIQEEEEIHAIVSTLSEAVFPIFFQAWAN
jgi:hypothetical protein